MPRIEDEQKLTDIFGYWPSFHDAEVLSLTLNRHGEGQYNGPTLNTTIHVFEMTREVDAEGYCVLRKHTIVSLRFFQVDKLQLDGFNYQNVLYGLHITDLVGPEAPGLGVCLQSAFWRGGRVRLQGYRGRGRRSRQSARHTFIRPHKFGWKGKQWKRSLPTSGGSDVFTCQTRSPSPG